MNEKQSVSKKKRDGFERGSGECHGVWLMEWRMESLGWRRAVVQSEETVRGLGKPRE